MQPFPSLQLARRTRREHTRAKLTCRNIWPRSPSPIAPAVCHVCVGGDGVGGRAGPSQFFPKSRYFLSASASRSSKRSPMGGRSVEPRCRPAPAFCRMEGPLCGQEPPPKQIRSECRVQTSWRRPISARQLRCGRDLRPSARPAGLPKGEDPGKGFRSAPRDCVV